MIFAHLPSGYLLGRGLGGSRRVLAAVMIGSGAPDLDMLWFWLVDQGQTHHHRFWPAYPRNLGLDRAGDAAADLLVGTTVVACARGLFGCDPDASGAGHMEWRHHVGMALVEPSA